MNMRAYCFKKKRDIPAQSYLVWGGFMVRLIGTGGFEVVILIVVSH